MNSQAKQDHPSWVHRCVEDHREKNHGAVRTGCDNEISLLLLSAPHRSLAGTVNFPTTQQVTINTTGPFARPETSKLCYPYDLYSVHRQVASRKHIATDMHMHACV